MEGKKGSSQSLLLLSSHLAPNTGKVLEICILERMKTQVEKTLSNKALGPNKAVKTASWRQSRNSQK